MQKFVDKNKYYAIQYNLYSRPHTTFIRLARPPVAGVINFENSVLEYI
jgi:hypothetical protein